MRKHGKRIPRIPPNLPLPAEPGRNGWGKLRNAGCLPLPVRVDRAPNLGPIAPGDVGHAAVALEELVGYLQDREHVSALLTPTPLPAPPPPPHPTPPPT